MKKAKQAKPPKLFPQEQKLVRYLGKKGRASVRQIGAVVFAGATLKRLRQDTRMMHQRVGTIAFRINKKRSSFQIKPVPDQPGYYRFCQHHA